MVHAAGGRGSLDSQQVRSVLESTAPPRRGVQEMVRGRGANHQSNISVTALGSFYFGANYLMVDYFGPADEYIETVTIDGSKAGLVFGTQPKQFVIGATNGFSPSDVSMKSPASATPKFTLHFKKGVFRTGASISFTVVRDEAGTFYRLTQIDEE